MRRADDRHRRIVLAIRGGRARALSHHQHADVRQWLPLESVDAGADIRHRSAIGYEAAESFGFDIGL